MGLALSPFGLIRRAFIPPPSMPGTPATLHFRPAGPGFADALTSAFSTGVKKTLN